MNTLDEQILKRIAETKELLSRVVNKTTLTYVKGLKSLKDDYEAINDNENACKIADKIIYTINHNDYDNKYILDIDAMLLSSYDTKARNGDFKSYCIALEWKRPIHKQYFLPRMKLLEKHGVVQAFQDLQDDKLDLMVLNLPPRVGKSTLSLFFLSFRAGLYPDESILGNGHSTSLTQSFYNELINILTGEEYRFIDIFPRGQIVSKSAEYAWVDLGKDKRFHTLNFKSVDGGTTGLVEASNLLYCDDLVKDVETANNPERLEKLYYTYTSTIKDRKVNRLCKDGVYRTCPELHVNTPWSINDPTNRVIRGEMKKGNNDRVRIISIPCWNDNKESNFLYDYGKGFDTKYYEDMEQAEDPVIFSAKYLMKCIEREGRPFTEDQLNFFYELPDEKPDRIISYSDVSFGGDDYFSMPIAYVYDHDVYIDDVFFVNKIDPDISRPRVCDKIIQHKVERAGFEQNNGGMLYATLIEGDLKRKNYRCNITTHNAPSSSSKRDRILACQSEIKGIATEFGNYRVFFKEYSKRKDNPEYCAFMSNIYNWSQKAGSIQTKQHDDAPDSVAGMIINLLGVMSTGKAQSRVSRKQLGY